MHARRGLSVCQTILLWVLVTALQLNYLKREPYLLKWLEIEGVPLSHRVEDKLRLSKDKPTLRVNSSLTLAGIPPETFQCRLGIRSAPEWVIDQYQLKQDKRSGIRSDRTGPTTRNTSCGLWGKWCA
jgi:predicted helicase